MAKSDITSFSTAPQRTGCCGATVDMNSNMLGSNQPRPKDYTVCGECGAVCRFGEGLSIIPATEGELITLELEDLKLFRIVMEASRYTKYLRMVKKREGDDVVRKNTRLIAWRYQKLVLEGELEKYMNHPLDKPWHWEI